MLKSISDNPVFNFHLFKTELLYFFNKLQSIINILSTQGNTTAVWVHIKVRILDTTLLGTSPVWFTALNMIP